MNDLNLSYSTWCKTQSLKPVQFEFSHPTATSVSVAGTFNEWDPTKKLMHHIGNGYWLRDTILAPGTYEYCLVVDGQWIPDPLARDYISNPFGGKNSILIVPTHFEKAYVTELEEHFFANYY